MLDTFLIGEKAVYPAHGVGEIINIETKEIAGKRMDFYILKILDSDMTILVPVDKAHEVGLRKLIPLEDIPQVFEILAKRNVKLDVSAWNKRYRNYLQKIKTGSIFEISEVLRDLSILKRDKTLSFGEKKMLDTAKALIKKEISLSKMSAEEQVELDILKMFE